MFTFIRTSLCGLAVVAFVAGCSSERKTAKEYDIVGKVTAIAADKKTVTLDHEAIPGLMNAMEMPFGVASPDVVKDIQVGDAVKGKLRVQEGQSIVSLMKTGSAPAPATNKALTDEASKIQAAFAKLDPKDRALAEAQALCPVTEEPLGSMGVPPKFVINGQPVFVCCRGCEADAKADAAKTLAKVEELRKKKK